MLARINILILSFLTLCCAPNAIAQTPNVFNPFSPFDFFATTTMPTGKFKNAYGSRNYSYYKPSKLGKNAPLIVVLHGCFLSPEQMASGTGFNEYADKMGFAVLYPEQTSSDNAWKCWNWFKPENLKRDDGEMSIIVGMVKELTKKLDLDPKRVFVTGISAGGALTSNLLACYSDVFAGGLVHSGLEYKAAQTEQEAHDVMKTGPTQDLEASAEMALACSPARHTYIPMIVVHGDSDPFVGKINADRVAEQFFRLNLLIAKNSSLPTDLTTKNSKIPAQQQYGFPGEVTDLYLGENLVVKRIFLVGMGHGWSGGNSTAPYMEPRGINIIEPALNLWLNKK